MPKQTPVKKAAAPNIGADFRKEIEGGHVEVFGKTVVITIPDATENVGPSKSGKSMLRATTRTGCHVVVGTEQLKIQLNVY